MWLSKTSEKKLYWKNLLLQIICYRQVKFMLDLRKKIAIKYIKTICRAGDQQMSLLKTSFTEQLY